MSFKEVNIKDLKENFIKDIADEWMLISAGNRDKYNMMTASWGFMGEMWGADTAIAMVRPQRYTMELINENDYFSLSFYGDNKDIHKICGKMSGRDTDKQKLTGLTPVFESGTVYFSQARLVIICRKQYCAPLQADGFCDREVLSKNYNNDLHNMIFGKIEKVLINKDI